MMRLLLMRYVNYQQLLIIINNNFNNIIFLKYLHIFNK